MREDVQILVVEQPADLSNTRGENLGLGGRLHLYPFR
jgi:hypothetical protein